MSTETLKFFEDKSTEEIINWMLSNLSEDQIRMCLDQSGVPDTTNIQKTSGKMPMQIPTPNLLPASEPLQKILQPGEGSSKDPLPTPKKDAGKIFLDKYRKKCNGTGYIIKSVSKEGVEYYEFKEVEEDDNIISKNITIGEVGWVKNKVPISQFKDFCTDEDREVFELLKEENMETFLQAPAEIIEVSMDYSTSGVPPPIPFTLPTVDVEPEPTTVVEDKVEITEPMLKALKIQQGSSAFIQETYPDLFMRGLTMYPVFIYGSDGDLVLHLTTVVSDDKLIFIKDSTNKKLLNSKFKKITSAIQSSIISGIYTPSPNIQDELNNALKAISEDIISRISKIYDPIKLQGYTYFGNLEDESSQESFDIIDSEEIQEYNTAPSILPNYKEMSKLSIKETTNKKVSDMTISEIEERMKKQFGEQYARDYKPEKYINSLGFTNVRYVKRTDIDDSPIMVSRPIFTEFQGKPSVNMGPGKFGESDDELLFD